MSTETTGTPTAGNGQNRAPTPTAVPTPRKPVPGPGHLRRALGELSHGGHVVSDTEFATTPDATERADISAASDVIGPAAAAAAIPGNPFVYLFPELAVQWPEAHLPVDDPATVVVTLEALGSAMIEDTVRNPPAGESDNSTIPPVYTYWGQFIDHDLTANTDTNFTGLSITELPLVPRTPAFVTANLHNLRQPALNLDSLYGDGPGDPIVPYDNGTKLRPGGPLASATGAPSRIATVIPPVGGGPDTERDHPRDAEGKALIGDPRNDENLVVAQLHVAFRFAHNAVVDLLVAKGADPTANATFVEARRLLRWTYQWSVRNDFLIRLVPQEAITAVETASRLAVTPAGVPMPLEFSVAAYRFGHSMVRGAYDWNRNFGRPAGAVDDGERATFDQLFQFTGNGGFIGGAKALPDNWPVEWDRLALDPPLETDHLARKIDTNLTPPLDAMRNEGKVPEVPLQRILKRLAVRNLLRGYKLALPTGQAVARQYGLVPLTPEAILASAGRQAGHALVDGGLQERTPLWFYVLVEAQTLAAGNQLGPVGGRIVAETLIGQLRMDPESYLATDPAWTPTQRGNPAGRTTITDLGGPDIKGIADLLRFAGVLA